MPSTPTTVLTEPLVQETLVSAVKATVVLFLIVTLSFRVQQGHQTIPVFLAVLEIDDEHARVEAVWPSGVRARGQAKFVAGRGRTEFDFEEVRDGAERKGIGIEVYDAREQGMQAENVKFCEGLREVCTVWDTKKTSLVVYSPTGGVKTYS